MCVCTRLDFHIHEYSYLTLQIVLTHFSFVLKVQLLKQVSQASPSAVLMGQYATYSFEAAREIPESNVTSLVPTFAAALLKVIS